MSKLKVTTISDPDNDNTAISIDTSGNITIPNNATFSGTVTGAGGGKVLQVVEATPIYTSGSTNQTSYQNVISASITPSATSSKIMVYFSTSSYTTTSTGNNAIFTLFRDSTDTSSVTGDYVFRKDSDGTGGPCAAVINKLDSPSSTSSVTYTVKFKQESTGGDTYYSFQGGGTFLTLMEIGA